VGRREKELSFNRGDKGTNWKKIKKLYPAADDLEKGLLYDGSERRPHLLKGVRACYCHTGIKGL